MNGRNFLFPHRLPDDSAAAAAASLATPFMDEIELDLALEGLNALSLGKARQTDVLSISLSATDAIGHGYGQDSREMHDNVLRLDRNLGAFIDSLFKLRDSTRIAFALTADHGVARRSRSLYPCQSSRHRFESTSQILRPASVP